MRTASSKLLHGRRKKKKRRVFYAKRKQSNDKCGSIAVMTQRVSSGVSHISRSMLGAVFVLTCSS